MTTGLRSGMRRIVDRVRRFARELKAEWKGRRAGRRAVSRGAHPIREIVGPTGYMFSNGWSRAAEGQEAFHRSFDPQIPPSIHVSHRDSIRANQAMPLSERCIEDWNDEVSYPDPHDTFDLRSDRPSATPDPAG